MPKASSITLTIGTKQLVVHEALETTTCCSGSKSSSLTPMTKVASASPDGAEMMTRFTGRRRWPRGVGPAGERPGGLDHDVGARARPRAAAPGRARPAPGCCWSPTSRSLPSDVDRHREAPLGRVVAQEVGQRLGRREVVDRRPPRRRPRWPGSARRKLRPMRPNPLIPTRTVMSYLPLGSRPLLPGDLCQQTRQRLRQSGRAVDQACSPPSGGRRAPATSVVPSAIPPMVSQSTTSTVTSCLARAATWAATS